MSETKQIIPGSGWDAKEWLSVIIITIGVALITIGITYWAKEGFQHGILYLACGVLAVILPFLLTVPRMLSGKLKHEYPTASKEKLSKGDTITVFLFVLAFALMIIGIGVALASILLTRKYGWWGFGEYYVWYGLLSAGAPMILVIILSSIFLK